MNCLTCFYCSVKEQYCAYKDLDLGYRFMRENTNCMDYKRKDYE